MSNTETLPGQVSAESFPYGRGAFSLKSAEVRAIAETYGTPVYVYSERVLQETAACVRSVPAAFGLTARFAMKACPNRAVLQTLHAAGVHIDASSSFEAERAMRAGIPASHIQITTQELPENLKELHQKGVLFNACSLLQLEVFGQQVPGAEVSVRMNPGLGSGARNRTNTGGPGSSFGIWHELLDQVLAIAGRYSLKLTGLHSHIGSGTDITVWERCADLTLGLAAKMPAVTRVSLGGGFKVARVEGEKSIDLHATLGVIRGKFEEFAARTGRKLHLEIEPGTLMVANSGIVISRIQDSVTTGSEGYRFLKLDAGMTEVLRPSLYGAQHGIHAVSREERADANGEVVDYVVVGHCCESGDILTPAVGDPEGILPRSLAKSEIGDYIVISGAGAYCLGFAVENYNSFPAAAAVMVKTDGTSKLVRRRQTLDETLALENVT